VAAPASHRLGLLLAPPSGAGSTLADATWAARAKAALAEAGLLGVSGASSPVDGGCAAVRAEAYDRERFVANRQGGFRVTCPDGGGSVVPLFNRAIMAWRDGLGPRRMACSCGAEHDLADLRYAPPAAFTRSALVLEDVGGAAPTEAATRCIEAAVGPFVVVWRRG
jgi:hypothetical protein